MGSTKMDVHERRLYDQTRWWNKSKYMNMVLKNRESLYFGWRGEVATVLDSDIVVSEFELLLRYYVHFWTNTLKTGKDWIVQLLSFYRDDFGIK